MAKRKTKSMKEAEARVEEMMQAGGMGTGGVGTGGVGEGADVTGGFTRPKDDAQLHAWIARELGVTISQSAIVKGHAAPFSYLSHTFFEPSEAPVRGYRLAQIDEMAKAAGEQIKIAGYSDRDVVLWANRGGGKTFLGALATVLDLVFKPTIDVKILAGSREQALRMFAHLRRFFSPRLNPMLAAMVDGKVGAEGFSLCNGSSVEIMAQSHTSVRGARIQKLRCDEVELFKPDIWEAAQFVTRSKMCGEVFVHGSVECLSTMHLPFGLMHTLVQEAQSGRRKLFKWGVLDSMEKCPDRYECTREINTQPHGHRKTDESADHVAIAQGVRYCPLFDECGGKAKQTIAPGGHMLVADVIAQKGRVSRAAWESEMMCLRPRREDAVLPEFSVAKHVTDFTTDGDVLTSTDQNGITYRERIHMWIGGMDFGGRAPTVMLWIAVDVKKRAWVVDEYVKANEVFARHLETIVSCNAAECARHGRAPWPFPEYIAADPAGQAVTVTGEKGPLSQMAELGLKMRAPRSRLFESLSYVRNRLDPADGSRPHLMVHARCFKMIESLSRYHYSTTTGANEEPVKDGSDHCVDALRYAILTLDRPMPKEGNYVR